MSEATKFEISIIVKYFNLKINSVKVAPRSPSSWCILLLELGVSWVRPSCQIW